MHCPIYHWPVCKDFKVQTFGIRSLQTAAAGVGREERDNFVRVFYWMSAVGKAMREKKRRKKVAKACTISPSFIRAKGLQGRWGERNNISKNRKSEKLCCLCGFSLYLCVRRSSKIFVAEFCFFVFISLSLDDFSIGNK